MVFKTFRVFCCHFVAICALLGHGYTPLNYVEQRITAMAVTVTVTVAARVQAAAKKLPLAESKFLGEFIRLVFVMGINLAPVAAPKA
jgi:hypothetical protein